MIAHNYIFFRARSKFHDLSEEDQNTYKKAFEKELASDKHVIVNTYSTLGLKAKTIIMIWFQADSVEAIQNFLNKLMHTKLGRYLVISHTLLGMTRPTQYSPKSTGHLDTNRKGGKYFIIYPFTKTQAWYMHDFDTRKNLMWGHVQIGKKFPQITQLLLYSYGIDDSEFLVSYETDELADFQSLVMALRSDKVREYTQKDTPIYLCIYRKSTEVLSFL